MTASTVSVHLHKRRQTPSFQACSLVTRKALSQSTDAGESTSAMVENRPAILIAEDQIFIAFEAERIISEAFDCEVQICRRDQLPGLLSEKSFHVIILEHAGSPDENQNHVALVRQSTADLVLLTAGHEYADALSDFPGVPLIRKPFHDAEVRKLIGGLLSRRLAEDA